jgi:hypothetical protein
VARAGSGRVFVRVIFADQRATQLRKPRLQTIDQSRRNLVAYGLCAMVDFIMKNLPNVKRIVLATEDDASGQSEITALKSAVKAVDLQGTCITFPADLTNMETVAQQVKAGRLDFVIAGITIPQHHFIGNRTSGAQVCQGYSETGTDCDYPQTVVWVAAPGSATTSRWTSSTRRQMQARPTSQTTGHQRGTRSAQKMPGPDRVPLCLCAGRRYEGGRNSDRHRQDSQQTARYFWHAGD